MRDHHPHTAMSLVAGTRLGPYEIVSRIGAGGMGEVFRARDTRLERNVAVKILPPALALDPERRRRFEREARTISQLNHPNICTLHDIGSEDGVTYLVMELVEGESLAERLRRGPLPPREAVRCGAEIAGALSRAHVAGVIHRDLKPANIMLARSGAKLLDFGLARIDGAAANSGAVTAAQSLTAEGVAVGTIPYMAPEQLQGAEVDARSDIFSLGGVVYEMLTGARPFRGESATKVMVAIAEEDPPPPSTMQAAISPALDRAVMRCLAKEPDARFQCAADVAHELRWIESGGSAASGDVPRGRNRRAISTVAALVLAAAALAATVTHILGRRDAPGQVVQFRQLTFDAGEEMQPSIAPDGKTFVFVKDIRGNRDIFLQRTDGRNAINLTPDSAADESAPAFSPDGNLIAFRSEREGGGIFVMGATGESVRRLTERGYDPSWSPDGTEIVYGLQPARDPSLTFGVGNFEIVNLGTGQIRTILETDDTLQPRWSPQGDWIAFWANNPLGQRDIWTTAASGKPGTARNVTDDLALDWSPAWSADGRHLYFSSDRDGTMNVWRVAVDPKSGGRAGEPEQLRTPTAYAGFLSAAAGALVFESRSDHGEVLLASFDAATERITVAAQPLLRGSTPIRHLSVSPDGRSIAFTTRGGQEDIFVLAADGLTVRQITDDAFREKTTSWWPDGSRIVFFTNRTGRAFDAWSIRPDGSGATQLTTDPYPLLPTVSRDGRRLAALWTPRGVEPRARVIPIGAASASGGEDLPTPKEGLFFPAAWSPGDRRLAGTSFLGRNALFVYTFATRRMESFPIGAIAAAFLDENRILYVDHADRIGIVDVITGADRAIGTVPVATPSFRTAAVAISPDGRTIAIYRARIESDIWWMSTGSTP